MSSWERFKRMYDHREADRIPIIDDPWACTLRRWQREGMPAGVDWCDYFDIDKVGVMNIDISPRYPEVTLEETDRYAIRTSPWGVTLTNDRIPWDSLKQNYDKWRAEGRWIRGVFWFRFDVAHSWMMGTENMLVAMIEEPEFVQDIFETYLSHTSAVKWNDADAILAEIDEKVPVLKQNGGFIFSSDHSIPNSVSLDNMKRIVAEVNWQAAAARGAPPGKPAIALCRREGSPAARDGGVHRLGLRPAGLLHTSAARRGQLWRAARPRGLPRGIRYLRKVRPSGRGR